MIKFLPWLKKIFGVKQAVNFPTESFVEPVAHPCLFRNFPKRLERNALTNLPKDAEYSAKETVPTVAVVFIAEFILTVNIRKLQPRELSSLPAPFN